MRGEIPKKIMTARARVSTAEWGLENAVRECYPIGCLIEYTTATYSLVYRADKHSRPGMGTHIFCTRMWHAGPQAERRFDGASTAVTLYRK